MPPPSGSRRVFGQAMGKPKKRGGSGSNFQRQFGGGGGKSSSSSSNNNNNNYNSNQSKEDVSAIMAAKRRIRQQKGEIIDEKFGYETFAYENTNGSNSRDVRERRGWLFNMLPTTKTVTDAEAHSASGGSPERAGLDLFFWTPTGQRFKTTILYRPYFYVLPSFDDNNNNNNNNRFGGSNSNSNNFSVDTALELLISSLLRQYEGILYNVHVVHKIDLDQPNHLSPSNKKGRPMLKLMFDNVSQLMEVRSHLKQIIEKNQSRQKDYTFQDPSIYTSSTAMAAQGGLDQDPFSCLVDIREYDVPYVVRVCTDLDIRVGTWYTVTVGLDETGDDDNLSGGATNDDNTTFTKVMPNTGGVTLSDSDNETKADPTFLAFDIECTKAPLKFPSADVDEIFMISYMVSGPPGEGPQGYLICSRSVVSRDVDDFEYTPMPKYPGPFHIFNEPDEKALLRRFFSEYQRLKPQIVVTYNGDFFDWPFVEARAEHHGFDMFEEMGVEKQGEEYSGRCCVHLDAFHWVQRDSYLPQGAQGLKAVTKYKLGYDPVEVDPEDMVRFAQERPVHMASYSVSDAVATFYLYEKYVHLFIFSLCTIIPMGPEDVLRKGSGTLCEMLLMVQACTKDIICPNKQVDPMAKFHNGHLLESETYIGGKVECLETGVYRSDIEYDFDLKPSAFQGLIDSIDRDLNFAIEVEAGLEQKDVANYDEIRSQIVEKLELLRDRPVRKERPFVYHLDVGAMYPNIILTNRLQPSAMVNDADCAACDFNQAKNGCKREMEWVWRGDYNPAEKNEYERFRQQLTEEKNEDGTPFNKLPLREQEAMIADRLKKYSRMAYKKTKVTEEVTRKDVVCMRENDFYVETVRRFRDRRYELKKMTKTWKKKIDGAKDAAAMKEAEDRTLVYDSLQVAHKCILNSFYGYVMRKGARWRSMEMAGIVTKTGADLITQARILVEQIGRPLELDTDGIWCILPKSFPDVYSFKMKDGSKIKLEYPCVMLNADVHANFTNHQYQNIKDADRGTYQSHSECSIFFEVDGPYRCMVIPASTEEGKLLKKRYAVFNFDGSMAELKGFELKRRGELELIKTFQAQVFERFLNGRSLEECYASVADIANHWIDVLDTQGECLDDDEVVELISENRSMSRQLDDYGEQKGTSQTTARRLGEFLGAEIIKDKGLNCKFIIAEQPYGAPVTERAIPTAIWKAEPAVMKHYLRKWLKAPGLDGDAFDIRNVLDWDYYMDRLGKTIQKIITIPAALQKVSNPVPRIAHPAWLDSKVASLNDSRKQRTITSMFKSKHKASAVDMEDIGSKNQGSKRPVVHSRRRPTLANEAASNPIQNDEPDKEPRIELSAVGFDSWLEQKKLLWRKKRKEQKRQRVAGTGGGPASNNIISKRRKTGSMEGYIRDAAQTLTQSEWQVIEIHEMTSSDDDRSSKKSSGEMAMWVMVGSASLHKIYVTVPRIVYVSSKQELTNVSADITCFRRMEKALPHGKTADFLYEITMPEEVFQNKNWVEGLRPLDEKFSQGDCLQSVYETGMPLLARAMNQLGCVSRVAPEAAGASRKGKSFSLMELGRVERPTEGEYLHQLLSYKRIFMYARYNPARKSGLIGVFIMEGGSGSFGGDSEDITRPGKSGAQRFDVSSSCHFWVIRPKSKGQANLSVKRCQNAFATILQTIQTAAPGEESDFACVSSNSVCQIANLSFVDDEKKAYQGANELISKSNNGPTLLLLNSSKPILHLRRHMSAFGSLPVVDMPFPPGPAHSPSGSALPVLNWEQPILQLCLEAYLYMNVMSWPNRVNYARYGRIPVGNIGADENLSLYDVQLSRFIQNSRALSWASPVAGSCDSGLEFLPSGNGGTFPDVGTCAKFVNQDEIWCDDDELVSPVIRREGCYRSVCVDIDIHDLAIAAFCEVEGPATSTVSVQQEGGLSSPLSVALFDSAGQKQTQSFALGDEMSTRISLHIVKRLVSAWLHDASRMSEVADELLHHVYRLVSTPGALLHDPALHRIVHSLMKSTFLRLLGELQRLGCTIVHATFQKVTIATNKKTLAEAEEYINFLISTIQCRSGASGTSDKAASLSRVALRPRQFHSHLLFLDEYNFGTMHLERHEKSDEILSELFIPDDDNPNTVVVPSVVTAWSVMNYLGNELAQEYFRVIIGRFSKEILKKEVDLVRTESQEDGQAPSLNSIENCVLAYKKKVITKHFASSLTRAVSEILKDGVNSEVKPPFRASGTRVTNPALEFIKTVIRVLELDSEVENEVQILKRSLMAQVGVAEYSTLAQWVNPCPSFKINDVFCKECQASCDLNICHVLPNEEGTYSQDLICEDCHTPYDGIEDRLIAIMQKKILRFQLQDIRNRKTNRVVTKRLPKLSEDLTLDTSPDEARNEIELLKSVADHFHLPLLKQITIGILGEK